MYKALYNFRANDARSLSFNEGESFVILDSSNQNWWQVQNAERKIGFVPVTYITKDEVPCDDVLLSVDRAIEAIHLSAMAAGGKYTLQQQQNLLKLADRRFGYEDVSSSTQLSPRKRNAPPPPPAHSPSLQRSSHTRTSHTAFTNGGEIKPPIRPHKARPAPPPPPNRLSSLVKSEDKSRSSETTRKETVHSPYDNVYEPDYMEIIDEPLTTSGHPETKNVPSDESLKSSTKKTVNFICTKDNTTSPMSPDKSLIKLKEDAHMSLGTNLIESVRVNTSLSYEKSKVAVVTVLSRVGEAMPGIAGELQKVLDVVTNTQCDDGLNTHDAKRLLVIFSELRDCKDDSQQRSWALHEDEAVILEYLEELLSILTNANPATCRMVITRDSYECILNLVQYYQMESRVSIRILMLQVFGALCELDKKIISILLTSVLPLELVRDMKSNKSDIKRLCYSAMVLSMVLSMGEPLPVHHYEHLNEEFISFLIDNIESPPEFDDVEQTPDLFVNVILAFNLHFSLPSESFVMQALARRGTAKVFTEKVMLLVNRGDDPVRIFNHKPKPQDSVLKFFADMYSANETAGLLYTNDAMVLIDIIVRQLSDLPPGDKTRTEYLSLMYGILRYSPYDEHLHRRNELQRCFMRIYNEEDVINEADRYVIRSIWTEFQHCFSCQG